MASVGRITIDLMARTAQFSQGLKSAQGDLKRFSGQTKQTMGGISSLALPAGLTFGFGQALRGVEEFNRAMARSLSIMDGVSASMREKLAGQARAVAFETTHSTKDLAAAYYELASAGLDAERSLKALPVVAKFAQASGTDLSESTQLLTTSVSALGLSSTNATTYQQNLARVSDVLARSANVSEASIKGLAEALTNKAAASARLLGQDVEEVVAVLSVFAKQGKAGEAAGEAYAIVMRDLQNAAIDSKDAFKQMGVEVFDAAGEMRNIADIIEQLEKALTGLSDEQTRLALTGLGFQDRSVHQIQSLLGFSTEIRRLMEDFRANAAGESNKVADAMVTPFQRAMQRLNVVMQSFAQIVGTPILNGIAKMIDMTTKLARVLVPLAAALLAVKAATTAWALATKAAAAAQLMLTAAKGGAAAIAKVAVGIAAATAAIVAMNKVFKDFEAAGLGDKIPESVKNFFENEAQGLSPSAPIGPTTSPVSGVGAVQVGTAEAFNNMQKAAQQQANQALMEEKLQTKKLDEAVSLLKRIERGVGRPEKEVEFV